MSLAVHAQLLQRNNSFNYYSEKSTSTDGQCKGVDQFESSSKGGLLNLFNLADYIGPSCNLAGIANSYSLYSKKYCESVLSCSNTKLQNDKKIDLKKTTEIYAELYLQEKLGKIIVKMERIERVRKFAEKKDMNVGKTCTSRFNSSSLDQQNKCFQRFDKVFKMISAKSENYGDYASENITPKLSSFNEYFKKRVEYSTDDIIHNRDDFNLEELSKILSSKKPIEEKKIEFYKRLSDKDNGLILDPILSFQNNESFATVHKKFLDNLLIKDNLSEKEAREKLVIYRQEKAKEILNDNGKCDTRETFDQLCESSNEIASGKQLNKNLSDAQKTVEREIKNPNKELLKRISATYLPKDFSKANGNDEYESAKIILEAARCTNYKYDSVSKVENTDVFYSAKAIPRATIVEDDKPIIVRNTTDDLTKIIPINDQVKLDSPESIPGNSPASTTAEISPVNNIGSPIASPINAAMGNNNLASTSIEAVNQTVEEAISPPTVVSNDEKEVKKQISDLTKRLETANANIEKLKAENEAVSDKEKEKEKVAKINDENKVISDLKAQITDLKIKQQAIKEQQAASIANAPIIKPEVKSIIADVSNGQNNQSEQRNLEAPDYGDSQNNAYIPDTSNNSANANSYKRAIDNSSKKSYDIALSDSSSKTTESFSADISKKITELDNKPFYIEEGGMIIQIIPILKDGKIVMNDKGEPAFVKLTKGKVGEELLPKGSVLVAAPIVAPADLVIKEEKLTRNPAQIRYSEFKKVIKIDGEN